jgi:NAD(P)H-hydrate epimerase
MRQIDSETIENRGIPGPTLMEAAGSGITERILSDILISPSDSRVAIFCGNGNNGGDGFVIGRLLHKAGAAVLIFFVGPPDKLTPDARLNYDRVAKSKLPVREVQAASDLPDHLEADLIIDAIFGTGFSGSPRSLFAEIIEYINVQEIETVAVDMPSGLNADTGRHEGAVVEAGYTYTLALPKYGLFTSPGRELAGLVEAVPIGIPADVVESFDLKHQLITAEQVSELLPERKPDGHKGDFGRLFVIAGSTGMTGAASLTAEAAIRTGCGLVTLGCPRFVQPILATKLTEVMTHPLPDVAKKGCLALRGLGEIRKVTQGPDALVIGPGLGQHHETAELVRRFVSKLECPSILDADGLNALAGHPGIIQDCSAPLVLTPHPGEFNRLVDIPIPEDILERMQLVGEVAAELGVVLVLKGSPTLIAEPSGNCYLNPTGNNGMATGGSGDLLSGMIGSFMAQGLSGVDAAVVGVFMHGLAGDYAAEEFGTRAMIAGDMISHFPAVFDFLE